MSNNVIFQIDGLTKRYGALTAVNNLTLDIYDGEVFGFLGPNGAGKTTSIQMMCGLLKPDVGRVLLHGVPITGSSEIRARVGMCPQSIVLWERLTCIEQLQFIGQMYGLNGADARRRGERLLDELDLANQQDKQAHVLSGGMQRRLNLAMALVHDPQILVLDEPEAGLDPQSRVKVREYIQSLAHKKTVILTTHNMDEADRVADRVAIIDHGELLVQDTPEGLKRRVGEGDVIEIALNGNGTPEQGEIACKALAALTAHVTVDTTRHKLHVHALDAVGKLSAILETLATAGLQPGEVSIRANTLEDVFIQLTGRRLRE